ncbi:MAG: type II and III secretion system protein [Nitrosospira sp.]|nr:type II and III secretion system protein [Nitrosospira sp.]MBI0411369.1 type II and III secretion system protein [Nitrosospira sp.]
MRIEKYIAVVMLLATFAGCASNKAFVEGKRLITEGKLDTGLASLEKAAREEPDNLEIRVVLARQREAVARRLLFEADNARSSGDLDASAQGYRRVLELNLRDERAQAGLEAIDMDRRHIALLKQAKELLDGEDNSGAESKIRLVMQENPMRLDARQLIKRLTEVGLSVEKIEPAFKTAFKQLITLEFRDTSLKSIFEIIARTSGINFIFDKDVKQDAKTTIFIRNNHIEDVFKLLLVTNQLTHKVLNDNSVLIYPNTPAKQKEYQELMLRSFYVANVDVKQMVAMVRGLVKTKDIHVDEKLNLFVMKDTPEAIRLVERLLALNDLADPEVMLEVEILEIARNDLLNLGIQFPTQMTVKMLNTPLGGAPIGGNFEISQDLINNGGISNRGLIGAIINPGMIANFKQTGSIVNVLANPRIRVKNREKAKVLIGDKVPVVTSAATATGVITSTVTYLEVGLKLDVEPTISLQNEVSIQVSLEVSNIVKEVPITGGGLAYQVGTRTAATTLSLKDGETQVLAGLITDDERSTFSKLPGFGDLPGIGRLFSNPTFQRTKTEIALLITPRIVRNIARPAKPDSEFHFGTENTIGMPLMTVGKVAARSLSISSSSVAGTAVPTGGAEPAVPAGESGIPASAAAAQPNLALLAPSEVSPGKLFSVSVNLAGAENLPGAELELSYDATALEALDAGEKPGTRLLKLDKGGGSAELQFRVIAQRPGTTQISIQRLTLQGRNGDPALQILLPPAVNIDIR